MSLTGEQFERLSGFFQACFKGFTAPYELAKFLKFRLNRDLGEYTLAVPGSTTSQIAFDLISGAERQGWTERLIAAAQDFRPENRDIALLAEELGVVDTGVPRAVLEGVVKKSSKFVDVDAFFETYGIRRGQVCRVEYPVPEGTEYGTGFLVGADLILTARHVVAKAEAGKLSGDKVVCRFDYKKLPSGKTLDGTVCHLTPQDWLVFDRRHAKSDETGAGQPEARDLDYALLRLASTAGADVLGRGNTSGSGAGPAEADAAKRGWITLSKEPPAAVKGANLLLLQHPDAEPMKMSIGEVLAATSGFRVRHNARSLPGSSGSPCFNENLQVIAMHHAGDPLHSELRGDYNQGIPMANIVEDLKANVEVLKKRGIGPFWEQQPPAPAQPPAAA